MELPLPPSPSLTPSITAFAAFSYVRTRHRRDIHTALVRDTRANSESAVEFLAFGCNRRIYRISVEFTRKTLEKNMSRKNKINYIILFSGEKSKSIRNYIYN